MKRRNIPIIQLFAIVVVLFQYLITLNNDAGYTTVLTVELLIIYGVLLAKSIKGRGWFDLYTLLLIMMGLFSYGEIAFSFIDSSVNYRVASIGIELDFKEITVQKACLIYCAYMLALDIGISVFQKEDRYYNHYHVPFNIDAYKVGMWLLFVFAAFAFYRAFMQYRMLSANRLLLFKGGSQGLDLPMYIRITSTFFLIGYYIFTASKPPLKQFLIATAVYILVQIPDLMVGNRMSLGVLLVYLVWMMVSVYEYKVKMSRLLLPVIVVVLIFQYIGMSRVEMETTGIGSVGLIIRFLTMQATSFGLLCTFIQYTPNLSGPYPFVFDSLIGGLTGYTGQSEELMLHRANIGHQLVYEISPDYYFAGQSSGTSCVTELYEFGIFGVIIGAIVLAYMIYFIQKNFNKNRMLLLFSYIIFSTIVTSPRAGMFVPLYQIIRTLGFAWVAFAVYGLFTGHAVHLFGWFKNIKIGEYNNEKS